MVVSKNNSESLFCVKILKVLATRKINGQRRVLGLGLFLCCAFYFVFFIQSADVFYQKNSIKSNVSEMTIDRGFFNYLAFHLRDTPYDGVSNYTRFMITALGLKGFPDTKPLVEGMGLVVNDITSFQYPLSINPCRQTANNSNIRSLFIAVISAPNNFKKRATIRQTWSNHLTDQTNKKIVEESERYGDILQINIFDKYVDLSLKVAGLLNWVNIYCSLVDFVLKVDDDVYVNVHNLATVLHSLQPSERSVYGHACGGNHPTRNEDKWATSFENWPWYQFPIYFQGAGIVIAGSSIRSLLSAIQTTPYFIWDDMYLIGLCAVKADLQIRTSDRIFFDKPANPADSCFVHYAVMWTTQSAEWMHSSNKMCRHLYHKPAAAHCVVDNKIHQIDGPANASDFPFSSVEQN